MLASYVRQAELYGVDLVFETALRELDALELGYLSLRLQNLDPKWRPPIEGAEFAVRLLQAGADADQACRMAKISRRTLKRHQQAQDMPNHGLFLALDGGESWTNPGRAGDGSQHRDLSNSEGVCGESTLRSRQEVTNVADTEVAPAPTGIGRGRGPSHRR